jgi:hypothetical protein
MRLVNKHPAATYYLTQAGHHLTAIEAAVAYVDAGFARSRSEQTDDVSSEFSSIERDWVIETIYQGAYLRQYHLWEKDCKEYLSSQGASKSRETSIEGFWEFLGKNEAPSPNPFPPPISPSLR